MCLSSFVFRRGDQLDFDAIRVLKEDSVVVRATREGVPVPVEDGDSATLEFSGDQVYLLTGMRVKSQMVQAGSAAMIGWGLVSLRGLHKHQIGLLQLPTDSIIPELIDLVAQFAEKPTPECERPLQIGDVQLDMMKLAGGV